MLDTEEISTPRPSDVKINNMLSVKSNRILPFTGTENISQAATSIMLVLKIDRTANGTNFPITIKAGFKGETYKISMVPSSFSRVMEIEVSIAETSIKRFII